MHPSDKEIIRVISRFVQSYTIQVEKEEKDEVQEAEEDEDKLLREAKLLVSLRVGDEGQTFRPYRKNYIVRFRRRKGVQRRKIY